MRFISKQRNSKLGKEVASTYGTKDTCPLTCPMLISGACYGRSGYTNLAFDKHYDKKTGEKLIAFIQSLPVGKMIRYHVTGDFCIKNNKLNMEYINALIFAHLSRPDVKGWTYTHAWRLFEKNIFKDIPNLNVIASCETLDDVKEAKAKGFNTAIVASINATPKSMPAGIKICPHSLSKGKITCSKCQLCVKKDYPYTVAFPLHGFCKTNFHAQV